MSASQWYNYLTNDSHITTRHVMVTTFSWMPPMLFIIKLYLFHAISELHILSWPSALKNKWVIYVNVTSFEPLFLWHKMAVITAWNIGTSFLMSLVDTLDCNIEAPPFTRVIPISTALIDFSYHIQHLLANWICECHMNLIICPTHKHGKWFNLPWKAVCSVTILVHQMTSNHQSTYRLFVLNLESKPQRLTLSKVTMHKILSAWTMFDLCCASWVPAELCLYHPLP